MPNPRRQDEKLAALYEQVPKMLDCKGKCADSCGPIECSVRERDKIERASGRKLEVIGASPEMAHRSDCLNCSMLTPMGLCSVYEDRPMICRLFGTTEQMRCEHGCVPERWLSDDECLDLLLESFRIGGAPFRIPHGALDRLPTEGLGRQLAAISRELQAREVTKRRLVDEIRGAASASPPKGASPQT